MTATRADDRIDDLPVPPWVRPLSIEEQDALIQEAIDSLDRGEGIPHETVMAEMRAMIAEAKRRAGQR